MPIPDEFDFSVPVGLDEGNQAFFGRDVLDGLVQGIDDFVKERQPRWERRSYRTGPVALLGCSPWVYDDKLLAAIEVRTLASIRFRKGDEPRSTERWAYIYNSLEAQAYGSEHKVVLATARKAQ